LYWVAYLMLTAGLPGLFIVQADRIGKVGAAGFLLALAGSALTMAVSLITAHVLPATVAIVGSAATLTELVQPGGKLNSLLVPVVLTALTFFPGYILFGIASARAQAKSALLHPLLQCLLFVAYLPDHLYSKSSAPGRNRTCCLAVRSRTLCPVSYGREVDHQV
jgi:hypothetical protein